MYTSFYGLKEMPFGLTPDLKYIFKTESYLEVMSCLKYGITENKGIAVVIGEVGTGKTTALRSAIQQFSRDVLCVYMFNPNLAVTEFFEQFTVGIGLDLPRRCSRPEMLRQLGRFLAMRHSKGLHTVLFIDEAHGLSMQVLEEIRLLLNYETNSEKLIQIIMCGQPELRSILARPYLRQLKQRISLRCTLSPLSPFEVKKYVRFRLKTAGAEDVNLFDEEAIRLIARASLGIPRVVNNICDNALIHGYASGREQITGDVVDEAITTLDITRESHSAATAWGRSIPKAQVVGIS